MAYGIRYTNQALTSSATTGNKTLAVATLLVNSVTMAVMIDKRETIAKGDEMFNESSC